MHASHSFFSGCNILTWTMADIRQYLIITCSTEHWSKISQIWVISALMYSNFRNLRLMFEKTCSSSETRVRFHFYAHRLISRHRQRKTCTTLGLTRWCRHKTYASLSALVAVYEPVCVLRSSLHSPFAVLICSVDVITVTVTHCHCWWWWWFTVLPPLS